ncbi:NAD(P)/FAD-dependent oxidoreductase [Brachybacterium endophyticum]|uniref:NAD(P)/FAD-dependent oxidoreductase n=1 Tax=Brachybacterium endophyticum TaxID=2182385 RepID=A0A2U2RID2_9MICO|nr:NAD(P)/FAD-dependent oxidoreductase [Brachybacterium endophyticum]PWH05525.1 NAD(P)/FAD-dependent oxidoreductase [Brachybacterium endophyticum]
MTSAASSPDAVVVGSGPNGLAAAVVLARAGLSVQVHEAEHVPGGGARTIDLGLAPGIVHDICSAVHPLAIASPFLGAFDLPSRGVELVVPEASYAQPLTDEPAAIAWHDLERTASDLGRDGPAWRRLLGVAAANPGALAALALGDKRSIPPQTLSPRGLATAAALGLGTLAQGSRAWDLSLRTERARALLTGVSAHTISPLPSLGAGGTAIMLAALAHGPGWPIPVGGSQAITAALLEDLRAHGGEVLTDSPVRDLRELPPSRAVLLDTPAHVALRMLATRAPRRLARAIRRFPAGSAAAATVDLVLSGPIPWKDPDVGRAGTVHLGGTRAEMERAELEVTAGRMPEKPMVLLSDPTLVDPSREVDGLRPIWAYAHVPLGDPRDPTEAVLQRLEEAAPGVRDLVVAAHGIPAAEMSRHNRSLVGGDITQGRADLAHLVVRPTAAWDPYRLGDTGAWLCSSATPPGPGVHGMSGLHAARRVLRESFGIRRLPELGPGA